MSTTTTTTDNTNKSNNNNNNMRRVLVTGGNKGIGRAVVQRLLENYPDVHVFLGSRDRIRGEKACEDVIMNSVDPTCKDRLSLVILDVGSDESVKDAAERISSGDLTSSLFGIINNAGVGYGYTVEETVNINYFGPRRVIDAFGKMLERPGGRIVNVASASGPMFVNGCRDPKRKEALTNPAALLTGGNGVDDIDEMAKTPGPDGAGNPYGFSKALLNAYTMILSKQQESAEDPSSIVVNSCTPGFIDTDMTKGQGATNPTSKGAIPPVFCLMEGSPGVYYGSDCQRSPLFEYRGPGDPPYEGP